MSKRYKSQCLSEKELSPALRAIDRQVKAAIINRDKSAPKQRRQAGVSASKPARDSAIKMGDEVPGAKDNHGESSSLQQLEFRKSVPSGSGTKTGEN